MEGASRPPQHFSNQPKIRQDTHFAEICGEQSGNPATSQQLITLWQGQFECAREISGYRRKSHEHTRIDAKTVPNRPQDGLERF